MHTFEHLFATYVRNTEYADEIVYVGLMGCRTGFYFLTRDTVSGAEAVRLAQQTLRYIIDFTGEIPGSKRKECDNYLAHDLEGAKQIAREMQPVMAKWSDRLLNYPRVLRQGESHTADARPNCE